MSSPTTPGEPDQGLHDAPPDQGLHTTSPDQQVHTTPAATKSKTPLLVGIGAAIVVVIGIIAAIFH